MGKIRIRDHRLPASAKTVKFRPLRKKNTIFKWIILGLILSNAYFIQVIYPIKF